MEQGLTYLSALGRLDPEFTTPLQISPCLTDQTENTDGEYAMHADAPAAEDLGNVVALEHLNLAAPDQEMATVFYLLGMGFTRDPQFMVGPDNIWINIGNQQIHAPRRDAQVLPGVVGIVVRDLDALARRLESVAPRLSGTKFSFARAGGCIEVSSPWGTKFRCHAPGEFGRMALGLPYVELSVRPGAAAGIARFYTQVLGAPATTDANGGRPVARIAVGNVQQLVFRETAQPIPPYDGYHVAIYVNRVSGAYAFLGQRGLIRENLLNHQFRFNDIVDPDTGEKLAELEHEVRSMRHPIYMRALVNRDPEQTLESLLR